MKNQEGLSLRRQEKKNMKKRIFIEKKADFDVESPRVLDEIKTIFPQVKSVKVYNVYDIFGLESEDFQQVVHHVFAAPVTDWLHEENPAKTTHFAMEFLPGQFDQRADSAEQCIKLLTSRDGVKVRTGKLIEIEGIETEDLEKIKHHLINRVEAQEKDLSQLEIPQEGKAEPVPVHKGFNDLEKEALHTFYQKHGFSFDFDDLQCIQEYFRSEKRNPTETELRVLDTYWSDHCRHTTFETELTDITFEGRFKETLERIFKDYQEKRKFLGREQKPITLMDLATVCGKYFYRTGKLENLVVSDEINACTIQIEVEYDGRKEPWYLLFKNETHNHPTEIEPFGGASTCLGGAIRDPLSGRSFVYQAMRLSGAADVLEPIEKTLKGKLPQRTITKQAANGYSSYGNQIGLATTHVSEIYHEGYKAKRMEVGFVVGAVPVDYVRREKPCAGDIVIILGGATGRDGVGGATGSSKEQNENSIHTMSTEVQKGNAVEERKIQRLFRNSEVTRLIKKSNDFGAGGVSVAIGEIADSIEINLDVLPLKYGGLNGTELAISESQERMAVVIEKKDKDAFIRFCEQENILAVEVAQVTDLGRIQMFWKGQKIVDLSRAFLETNGSPKKQAVKISHLEEVHLPNMEFNEENLKKILADKNVASQKGLLEMFDSTVGATTVMMPLGGKFQETPMEGSVQTLPVLNAKEIETVSLASWGFDVELSEQNSMIGSAYAVVESVAKIVAMGGDYSKIRLSFQEYFEKLGQNEDKWGKPFASLLGAYDAQMNLELAAIGGKDSMSGTYHQLNVPPTLISFACADGDKKNIISPELKQEGNCLYHFHHQSQENGFPDYEKLKKLYAYIHQQISDKNIVSVKTVKDGGVAVALAKMCFGNGLGAEVQLSENLILEKNIGGLVVESQRELDEQFFTKIGKVTKTGVLKINDVSCSLESLLKAYRQTFEELFPTKEPEKIEIGIESHLNSIQAKNISLKPQKIANPRAFTPIFFGTNCEYDMQNAFRKEGADVSSYINLSCYLKF